MGDLNINWTTFALVYTALCCVIPMLVLAVGGFLAFRHGSSFLTNMLDPDAEQMEASYKALKAKYPNKSADALVRTVIHRQSLRCGAVGAVTSLGGFVTLPIALPVDMVVSYRIQGAMVNFIAKAYDYSPSLMKEEQAVASLVMFGSRQVTANGIEVATKVLLRVGGKTVAKIVPLLGALVGFIINYVTTQATGYLAASLYSGSAQQTTVSLWGRLRGRGDETETADRV
jgi:hypothetical protein